MQIENEQSDNHQRVFEYSAVTTLREIRKFSPCEDGWRKLLAHLGKTCADDEPLPLLTVLDSNGLEDALWVLDKTGCAPRLARHFGAWCAEQVLPFFEAKRPGDERPRRAIAVARNDDATPEELAAARAAAEDAARAAAGAAAGDAARDAAGTAAWAAARAAAGDAAGTAAWAAARDAARDAAWTAAGAVSGNAQARQLRAMLTQLHHDPR
jgi:hypothetical protein